MRSKLWIIILLMAFFSMSYTLADNLTIYVRPLVSGSLQQSTTFSYVWNFTTDFNCSNVLLSKTETVVTDATGIGYTTVNLSSLSQIPNYVCEFRNSSLRKKHHVGAGLFDQVRARNVSANWSNILAMPSGFSDGTDDGNSTTEIQTAINSSEVMYNVRINCSDIQFDTGFGASAICDGTDATVASSNVNMWVDNGTFGSPNATYFSNILLRGYVKADNWSNVTITESQISDLSHTTDTYNTTNQMRTAVNNTRLNLTNLTTAGGIGIEQSVDSLALKVFGYDDVKEHYGEFKLNSLGFTIIKSTSGFYYYINSTQVGGTSLTDWQFFVTTEHQDNISAAFGNSKDYSIVYSQVDDTLQFVDGSTVDTNVRMVIDSNGDVGMGVTNALYDLHVEGTTESDIYRSGYQIFALESGNNIVLGAHDSGRDTILYASNSEVMRLNSSGLVGVNTSTPKATLDVKGNISSTDWTNVSITESQISDLGSYLPLSGGTLTDSLSMASAKSIWFGGTTTRPNVYESGDDLTFRMHTSGHFHIVNDGASSLFNVTNAGNVQILENITKVKKVVVSELTCFNSACTFYANASDGCTYYPSGGKICGG